MYVFELEFSSFLELCSGVGLLDYVIVLLLVFLVLYRMENPFILFSTVAAPIYIPTNNVGASQLLFKFMTLLYIKQTTNKDLLYSAGNSIQYSLMTYTGKKSKKERITDSLGYTAKSNTTL